MITDTETLAEELKPQLEAIRERFDAAATEDEERAIAKEGMELVARALIRQMLAKVITPEAIAAFAGGHGGGYIEGGIPHQVFGRDGIEYVVPTASLPKFGPPHFPKSWGKIGDRVVMKNYPTEGETTRGTITSIDYGEPKP